MKERVEPDSVELLHIFGTNKNIHIYLFEDYDAFLKQRARQFKIHSVM